MHKRPFSLALDFLRGAFSLLVSAAFFAIPAATADSSSTSGDTSGSMLRYVGGGPGPAQTPDTVASPDGDPASDSTTAVVVKRDDDTVFVLKRPGRADAQVDVPARVGSLRMRGYGASGGFQAGASAINVRPIEDFARHAPLLRNHSFDFRSYGYEPFFMRGGIGYAGIGKGRRIGLTGLHGDADFRSSEYGNPDSLIVLNVNVSYFGFLIERAWTAPRWDAILGGTLGSGRMNLSYGAIDIEDYSTFVNRQDADLSRKAEARMGVVELHGGITYTPAPWVHFGGDITLPAFLSVQGFAPYSGEFITVNPGVRVRVVFGNLG